MFGMPVIGLVTIVGMIRFLVVQMTLAVISRLARDFSFSQPALALLSLKPINVFILAILFNWI